MAKGDPVSQSSTFTPPGASQSILQQIASKWLPQASQGIKLPDWSSISPFDPSQIRGQEMALGAAGGGIQGIADSSRTALQRSLSGEFMDPSRNPALQGTIDAATRPITQALTESALPSIRSGAVASGGFGSSRQGIAEGLASGRASQAIGDTSQKIAETGYLSGLDALTKGIGLSPQTANLQLMPGLVTSGVGDVRQNLAQQLLGEKTGRFSFEQLLPLLMSKELLGLARSWPGGTTTATGSGPQQDPLMQMLGLGLGGLGALGQFGQGAGGLGSLLSGAGGGLSSLFSGAGGALSSLMALLPFSDRRLKQQISKVGALADGTSIYRYRLLGEPFFRLGIMSDEVDPSALGPKILGYDTVDYHEATERSVRILEARNGIR